MARGATRGIQKVLAEVMGKVSKTLWKRLTVSTERHTTKVYREDQTSVLGAYIFSKKISYIKE